MFPNDGVSRSFSETAQSESSRQNENNAALSIALKNLDQDIREANDEIVRRYKATRASDEGFENIFASATRIIDLPHAEVTPSREGNAETADKIRSLDAFQSIQRLCEQNNRKIHVARIPADEDGNYKFAAVITYKTDIVSPQAALDITLKSKRATGLRLAA